MQIGNWSRRVKLQKRERQHYLEPRRLCIFPRLCVSASFCSFAGICVSHDERYANNASRAATTIKEGLIDYLNERAESLARLGKGAGAKPETLEAAEERLEKARAVATMCVIVIKGIMWEGLKKEK